MIEILSPAHAKGAGGGGGGNLNYFKLDTFIRRFRSDGAARIAVKGLMGHTVAE